LWWLLSLAICAIQFWTFSFDARINQDEVQIVDFGRATLQPDVPWALSWNIQQQIPVLLTSYLGPVLQELAFRLSAPSDTGVMLSSLFGALFAATFLLGWLKARRVPALISLCLALAFLLDPAFSATYRNGRVDGWAIAFVLAACWLLRQAEVNPLSESNGKLLLFLAGLASAMSVFIWPSALLMFPLLTLELFLTMKSAGGADWRKWISIRTPSAAHFALGGMLAAAVLLLPVFANWGLYLEGIQTIGRIQQRAAVIQPSILGLILVHDPIIVIVAVLSLAIRREPGVLVAFAVAVIIAWQTMIYPARLVYFLPYLLVIIGGAAEFAWRGGSFALSKPLLIRLLILLLMWNSVMVVGIRPFISYHQQPARKPAELISKLERVVGKGQHRVLVGEWAPYFAGRALGWQIFREGSPIDANRYEQFLLTLDFILVAETPLYPLLANLLRSENFELVQKIEFEKHSATRLNLPGFELHIPESGYQTILVYRPAR